MIPDELAKLFLSKTQIQKLMILKELESGTATFNSLGKNIEISKRQIKENAMVLLKEIKKNNFDPSITLLIDKESIQFKTKLKDVEYVELINDFREKYLSESSLFQALLFVLEKRSFSILTMAATLSYSESYAYKLFSKLKKFFYYMDCGIQLIKENDNIIQLAGDESTLRIFHYLVISVASKGNQWLFKTMTQKEILSIQSYINSTRYEKLSPIGKNRVNYIVAVYEVSLKKGYKLSGLDSEIVEIGESINKEKEINLYLNYLKEEIGHNEAPLHEELIHLAFVINYFTQEIRSDEEKQELGKALYSMKNNSIVDRCIRILDTIIKRYKLSKMFYYLLLYSLCNRLVVIHYLGLYKFMPLYNVPELARDMDYFVEECIVENLGSYRYAPSFDKIKYSFTQVITGYLGLAVSNKQKIYVEFFHRPEYKSTIENAIKHNYNQEVLQITNNYLEADMVISDTHGYDKAKFFYFRDVFDQDSWEELGMYLNKIISNEIMKNN
ncbi:TPA: helix-turn-helix domain-containing protein [Listeria monocytogenes]|nr:hypothetical protein [Listeria monocytogenes]